jgi:hypothetical protein
MIVRSRTITISVKRSTGEVFDSILNLPMHMMEEASKSHDGWWSFKTSRGPAKLKFYEDKELGILDHKYEDEEAKWHIPMRVVSNGDHSEVILTMFKPDEFTDEIFDERMGEMERMMDNMRQLIENN